MDLYIKRGAKQPKTSHFHSNNSPTNYYIHITSTEFNMYSMVSHGTTLALVLCLFAIVVAVVYGSVENISKLDPSMAAKQFNPSAFPAMPPELEKILPADVVQKLKTVHTDTSLSIMQKQDKIDRIMSTLPGEILDQIPAPPGFERLPDDVKTRLKQINRQTSKAWADKQKELQEYVKTLPQEQRAILMMGPMGGPPPPPSFGRRR